MITPLISGQRKNFCPWKGKASVMVKVVALLLPLLLLQLFRLM